MSRIRPVLNAYQWSELLKMDPSFLADVPEEAFSSRYFVWWEELCKIPEILNKCPDPESYASLWMQNDSKLFKKLEHKVPIDEWVRILIRYPQYIDTFTKWDKLYSEQWADLLCFYPELSSRFKRWHSIPYDATIALLSAQPQFWDKFSLFYLNSISDYAWSIILTKRPEFLDEHKDFFKDILLDFRPSHWTRILSVHPHLSTYVPNNTWGKFIANDWVELWVEQPELALKMLDKLRIPFTIPYNCWNKILDKHPHYAIFCDTDGWRYTWTHYADKLNHPQFAKYYDKSYGIEFRDNPERVTNPDLWMLSPYQTAKMLIADPSKASETYCLSSLDKDTWIELLLKHPKELYTHCPESIYLHFTKQHMKRLQKKAPDVYRHAQVVKLTHKL